MRWHLAGGGEEPELEFEGNTSLAGKLQFVHQRRTRIGIEGEVDLEADGKLFSRAGTGGQA